ncbi:MAG: mandelate racemase/muconate lactonizing enzyme family protein [Vulcanisaeta sp.]
MSEPTIKSVRVLTVMGNFEWPIVKVELSNGLIGYGECHRGPGIREILRRAEELIKGREVNIEYLLRLIRKHVPNSEWGVVNNAISGLETALWDVKGRLTGLPIYELLGGKVRDRVPVYADLHAGAGIMETGGKRWVELAGTEVAYNVENYIRRAREAMGMGFKYIKFDVDVPEDMMETEFDRTFGMRIVKFVTSFIGGVRDVVKYDVDIMIDGHWAFSVPTAIAIARELAKYDVFWFEDPVPPENIDAMREVKLKSPVPIATGEKLYRLSQFRELIEKGAIDIIHPDVQRLGGLLEMKKIAYLAEEYYVPVAIHNISSPIGTMANAHVASTIGDFIAIEWHAIDLPWWPDIVREGMIIKDGYITPPKKPGLGVELNERVAIEHAKDQSEVKEFLG